MIACTQDPHQAMEARTFINDHAPRRFRPVSERCTWSYVGQPRDYGSLITQDDVSGIS
jgi:hypothetical protein